MRKQIIFLIVTLTIGLKSFGQGANFFYEKGLEVVLDSLIHEIPKVKFFMNDEFALLDTSKDPFGGFECAIHFDDLKQNPLDRQKIIIPSKYRNRLKKNNFFNKLIYGNKLVELNIDVLYKDASTILFRANIYGREGGIFMFVQFKNNSLVVNEFCKGYSIY